MSIAVTTPRHTLWILALALACSSEDPPTPDAGPNDAGTADSGAPAGPAILNFAPSLEVVMIGTSVTLSYQVQTATSVQITQEGPSGIVNLLSSTALSGEVDSGVLLESTNFRLKAIGAGLSTERTIRVEVQIPEITIVDFSASPNPALPGEWITVDWRVAGADRVRLLAEDQVLVSTSSDAIQGQRRVRAPARSTKLILEASTPWRTRTQSLVLSPRGGAKVFDFSVEPSVLESAEGVVQLAWETQGESLALFANQTPIGGVPSATLTGSVTAPLRGPTLFTLRVEGLGQTAVARRIAVPSAKAEQEPNNALPQAQDLQGGVFGRTNMAADSDLYRLQLPTGGHLFVDLSAPSGDCSGLGLKLRDAQGRELIDRDAGEQSRCPRLDPYEDQPTRALTSGDYYLEVEGRRSAVEYRLATLVLGGRCGDGLRDGVEQCDDGGTLDGDGCSASCSLEITDTFTLPGVEALHADALGAGEVDYYQLQITSATSISIETGVPTIGLCQQPGGDTQLALLDDEFSVVASDDDSFGLCAALRVAQPLAAGTYFLRVRSFAATVPISAYQVVVRGLLSACGDEILDAPETCDDGNTDSGDGCSATCTIERLPTPLGQVQLPLRPGAVRRIELEITVPGQSITATTSDGQGGCAIDTRLILAKDGRYLG